MSSEASGYPPIPSGDQDMQKGRATRTNLLLSGTIEAPGVKGAVRIRNLSETGALLEGASLPPVGAHLALRRLQMEMSGIVVWAENGRCGVRFDGTISVAGWREGTWIAPVVSHDQARADSIQAAARAGSLVETPETRQTGSTLSAHEIDARIAAELIALRNMLEKAGEQLSEVPAVVELHTETLQNFDVACQILGHLAAVLSADNPHLALQRIGMEALRRKFEGTLPPAG